MVIVLGQAVAVLDVQLDSLFRLLVKRYRQQVHGGAADSLLECQLGSVVLEDSELALGFIRFLDRLVE